MMPSLHPALQPITTSHVSNYRPWPIFICVWCRTDVKFSNLYVHYDKTLNW